MTNKFSIAVIAAGGIVLTINNGLGASASAADLAPTMPVKAPVAAAARSDWTGFYAGGYFGYGLGSPGIAANAAPGQVLDLPRLEYEGLIIGAQAGYNYQFSNNLVLGAEADISFTDYFGTRVGFASPNFIPYTSRLRYFGTVRGRLGYARGWVLPYVTGGLAWAEHGFDIGDPNGGVQTQALAHVGWTAGAGLEFPIQNRWMGRIEYAYADFGAKNYATLAFDPAAVPGVSVDPRIHTLKLALNYRLSGNVATAALAADSKKAAAPEDWGIHGQTTFIEQGYFKFRSPYEGQNSLIGASQARNTWSTTAFIDRRLWDGGELVFDPELLQGFGLSDTLGAAGFPNGEAQKSQFPIPHPGVARLLLRQTFGLGGEQESVEDGANQLAGKRDISRVTVTVGKMAVGDIFDANTYAQDPRAQFMNWSIWAAGAYDFPADTVGYTWGAVAELNQKTWAIRAGTFLEPQVPNGQVFNAFPKSEGSVAELELRYSLFSQPGILRLLGFFHRGTAINFVDALADLNFNADVTQNRAIRTKYGFVINAEQAISDKIGMFSRLSWNDGKNEEMAFTDVDASASLGAVFKGALWGRPDDKIGVAGAINALSAEHRAFIAAGGLGILIGDGRLNYREEQVLETYYAINLNKWSTFTLDYQFIANPAYNADRGPVSVFGGRLHAEF